MKSVKLTLKSVQFDLKNIQFDVKIVRIALLSSSFPANLRSFPVETNGLVLVCVFLALPIAVHLETALQDLWRLSVNLCGCRTNLQSIGLQLELEDSEECGQFSRHKLSAFFGVS